MASRTTGLMKMAVRSTKDLGAAARRRIGLHRSASFQGGVVPPHSKVLRTSHGRDARATPALTPLVFTNPQHAYYRIVYMKLHRTHNI
jgi:hypothetical protein